MFLGEVGELKGFKEGVRFGSTDTLPLQYVVE